MLFAPGVCLVGRLRYYNVLYQTGVSSWCVFRPIVITRFGNVITDFASS